MTGHEKTAAVTRVRWLEQQLFEDGQVRRRITRETAQAIVDELNQLRAALGWLEIDLEGRWRWPDSDPSRPTHRRRDDYPHQAG